MRRRTLLILLVICSALMPALVTLIRDATYEKRVLAPSGSRLVSFGATTLLLPGVFLRQSDSVQAEWRVQIFKVRGKEGTLELFSQPRGDRDLRQAGPPWMRLGAWPERPVTRDLAGARRYARALPLFEVGALSLRVEGRVTHVLACFDQGGQRHVLTFRSDGTTRRTFQTFASLLEGLRDGGGQGASPTLRASLGDVERDLRWRAFSVEWLWPWAMLILGALALGVDALWTRRSGRRPGAQPGEAPPLLCLPDVEVGWFVGRLTFQVVCVEVRGGELWLHAHGRPSLRVPRAALLNVRAGQGLIPPGYLELALGPGTEFLRAFPLRSARPFALLFPKGLRLRIYTRDREALRQCLGV